MRARNRSGGRRSADAGDDGGLGAHGGMDDSSAADQSAGEDEGVDVDADQEEEDVGGTIATRTRTKLSLVNVPIDTLESYLPDVAEPVWVCGTCRLWYEHFHSQPVHLSRMLDTRRGGRPGVPALFVVALASGAREFVVS